MGQGSRPIRQRSAVRRTYWSALAVLVPVLTVLAAPAHAMAGDDPRAPTSLTMDSTASFHTDDKSATSEPLTTTGERRDGFYMQTTDWYVVVGEGRDVTVEAFGNTTPPGEFGLDTMLAVYNAPPVSPISG